MTATIEVTMDVLAADADRVVAFWREALGYDHLYDRGIYTVLLPPEGDHRPRMVFQRVEERTTDKSPVHVDLRVDEPAAEVARLQRLGASVAWTIDETNEGISRWTTMTDPQGTLFCVCPARKE